MYYIYFDANKVPYVTERRENRESAFQSEDQSEINSTLPLLCRRKHEFEVLADKLRVENDTMKAEQLTEKQTMLRIMASNICGHIYGTGPSKLTGERELARRSVAIAQYIWDETESLER